MPKAKKVTEEQCEKIRREVRKGKTLEQACKLVTGKKWELGGTFCQD